eukprot:GHVS01049940.1.p1 GENE.GHVS01049940.1~~GHVS01049940.1.p1  ORF type:complete len:320 (-),score=98.49 GHVS01049940.1:157-1116(-)
MYYSIRISHSSLLLLVCYLFLCFIKITTTASYIQQQQPAIPSYLYFLRFSQNNNKTHRLANITTHRFAQIPTTTTRTTSLFTKQIIRNIRCSSVHHHPPPPLFYSSPTLLCSQQQQTYPPPSYLPTQRQTEEQISSLPQPPSSSSSSRAELIRHFQTHLLPSLQEQLNNNKDEPLASALASLLSSDDAKEFIGLIGRMFQKMERNQNDEIPTGEEVDVVEMEYRLSELQSNLAAEFVKSPAYDIIFQLLQDENRLEEARQYLRTLADTSPAVKDALSRLGVLSSLEDSTAWRELVSTQTENIKNALQEYAETTRNTEAR